MDDSLHVCTLRSEVADWIAMRIVRQITAAFIGLLLTTNAEAAEFAYTCVIKAVYRLDDRGRLKPSSWEQVRGEAFSISRLTGEIIGIGVPTLMATSTEVINYGDSEWSFRALAHFKNTIQLIEVQEFTSGEIKPFIAASMSGLGILTGLCK